VDRPERRLDERELDALELRLREAGTALLSEAQLSGHVKALAELRARGRAQRVSGRLYAHTDVVADTRQRVVALIERQGPVTLAATRDALGLSRKSTQAFLEHLDAARVTRRLADDTRVLARRP
jgi:selenocysteine-specific elongation factor